MEGMKKTEKYNYTPEARAVFKYINEVKKTQNCANVPANEQNERMAQILRKTYKTTLQYNLLNLHAALTAWIEAGGKIETEEEPWKS